VVAAHKYYADTEKYRRLALAGLAEEVERYRVQNQPLLTLREKSDDD
jgi:hypothetical protein